MRKLLIAVGLLLVAGSTRPRKTAGLRCPATISLFGSIPAEALMASIATVVPAPSGHI